MTSSMTLQGISIINQQMVPPMVRDFPHIYICDSTKYSKIFKPNLIEIGQAVFEIWAVKDWPLGYNSALASAGKKLKSALKWYLLGLNG